MLKSILLFKLKIAVNKRIVQDGLVKCFRLQMLAIFCGLTLVLLMLQSDQGHARYINFRDLRGE
jgi:hypothetical protein